MALTLPCALLRHGFGQKIHPQLQKSRPRGRIADRAQNLTQKSTTIARVASMPNWMACERDEGQQGRGEVLEVLGQAPVPTKPGEGPLHNPAAPLDDFEADRRSDCGGPPPAAGPVARCRFIGLLRIVAPVSAKTHSSPGSGELDLVKYKARAVAVLEKPLNGRRGANRQTQCIDEGVDLASFHLLSRLRNPPRRLRRRSAY